MTVTATTERTLTSQESALVARIASGDGGCMGILADWYDDRGAEGDERRGAFWRWAWRTNLRPWCRLYHLGASQKPAWWPDRFTDNFGQPKRPHEGDLPNEVFDALTDGVMPSNSRIYPDPLAAYRSLALAAAAYTGD